MSRRLLLAGLGIAIAAALIVVIVSSRQSSGASGSGHTDVTSTDERAPIEPTGSTPTGQRSPSETPTESGSQDDVDSETPELLRDDGTVVRDHRTRSNAPPDLSASPAVPLKHARVDPGLIGNVRKALRPLVAHCAEQYASDIEPGASLRARIGVTISGGALTVSRVDVAARSVKGESLATCVGDAAKNVLVAADGHDDVKHHMLTFPFDLPLR